MNRSEIWKKIIVMFQVTIVFVVSAYGRLEDFSGSKVAATTFILMPVVLYFLITGYYPLVLRIIIGFLIILVFLG